MDRKVILEAPEGIFGEGFGDESFSNVSTSDVYEGRKERVLQK
jgi:hypothetical protein